MNDLAHNFTAQMDTPTDMQGVEQGYAISDLISTYTPATPAQIEPHEHLRDLALLLGADKLLHIDDTIMQGDKPLSVAGENVDTENTVAVVMYDERLEPSNLAFYPLNKTTNKGKPFLLNPHATANFVACDNWQAGKPMGERLAVSDLNNALALFGIMDLDLAGRTIITPFSDDCWQVINSVKASGERVTVFTDYSKDKQGRYIKDLYANALSRHNATLVITPEPLSIIYNDTKSYEVNSYSDLLAVVEVKEFSTFTWGKPEPLSDDNTPATPYPIHAFTGVLRGAVEAIAYHAQVPPAMAGQCVLGALATMLQQYINAPFGDGEHIPVSLFLLTRGASSDGKNRTVRLSHKVIKSFQYELDKKYREDYSEWLAQRRATPKKELEDFLAKNPAPVQKTLFVSSGTLQGIINEMLNNNQKSMTWVTSDAGQFFGGYSMDDKNSSKTISDLSDVWSEGFIDCVIKGNGQQPIGNKRAYDLRFTLDLQGQDEIIRHPLASPIMNGQGFLPRFLFAFPDSMRGKRVYNTPERMNNYSDHDPRLTAYWQACRMLLDPLPTKFEKDDEGNPIKINIGFTDHHARQAYADYQQQCEDSIGKGGRLEKYPAYAGRLAENANRIASLLAFFEGRTALTVDDIERASLLTEYSIKERLRYDGEGVGGDTKENDSQKLINWLLGKAKEKQTQKFNRTYIANNCPNPMRKSSKLLQQELDHLESAEYIRQESEGKKKVIYINPCLCK